MTAFRNLTRFQDLDDVVGPPLDGYSPIFRSSDGKYHHASADLSSAVILAPASSARNVIQPAAGNVIAAIVKANAAQSVDLWQWQKNGGAVLAAIGAGGGLLLNTSGVAIPTNTILSNELQLAIIGGVNPGDEGYPSTIMTLIAVEDQDGGAGAGLRVAKLLTNGTFVDSGIRMVAGWENADDDLTARANWGVFKQGVGFQYCLAFNGKGEVAINNYPMPGARFAVWENIHNTWAWWIDDAGYEVLHHIAAAPLDATVQNSQRFQWYDATPSATGIKFKQRDSAGGLVTGRAASLNDNGYFLNKKTTAPTDAELANNDLATWSDDSNVYFKKKTSTGTIKTATVALS